jgi:uncharacterized protein YukE
MSSNVQGMDTEKAREVGHGMGAQAQQVNGALASVTAMIAGLSWHGPDRQRFESDWTGSFAPQAQRCAETLDEHGRALCQQADRQDAASS